MDELPKADIYNEAINFREQGQYSAAIKVLQLILIKNSTDAMAYGHLAHCYLLKKQIPEAVEALNNALKIDSNLPVVQRNYVRLLLRQQNTSLALEKATQLYNVDSKNSENTLIFAISLLATNEIKSAKKLCHQAIEQQSSYAEAFAILGQIHLKESNKSEALSLFEKALVIKPHLTPLYSVVAGLHKENKNFSTAIERLQTALTYEEDNVNVMANLGDLLRLNEQTQAAIFILEQAIQIAPKNIAVQVNLATALQQNGALDQAKIIYSNVLSIYPEQIEILNNLGGMAVDDENWEEALTYFDKAVTLQPTRLEFIVNKGVALNNLKRYQEAEKIASDGLKIDLYHQDSHALLSTIFIKQGLLTKAEDYCHLILKDHPNFEKIHSILGGIFQNKNRLDKANDAYLNALKIKPTDESYALALAINYYLMSNYLLATDYLQKAFSIFSKPTVKKFKNTKVYVKYLNNLLRWWKNGRMEEWKNGRMEEWKNGRMEEWLSLESLIVFQLIT